MVFKADPEKKARKLAEQEQRAAEKEARAFEASPAGRARAAAEAGDGLFQIVLSIAETNQRLQAVAGTTKRAVTRDYMHVLDSIEAEGWKLEHVGYVFQPVSSQSRDRAFHSGEQTVVSGQLLGVYVFRATPAGGSA